MHHDFSRALRLIRLPQKCVELAAALAFWRLIRFVWATRPNANRAVVYAPFTIFFADPVRDPQGSRDRVPPADAARRYSPAGGIGIYAFLPLGVRDSRELLTPADAIARLKCSA